MGGSLLDNETRPGQSSAAQARDAGLVRILCVAREGAYDTSHEPPTADPRWVVWGLGARNPWLPDWASSPLARNSFNPVIWFATMARDGMNKYSVVCLSVDD